MERGLSRGPRVRVRECRVLCALVVSTLALLSLASPSSAAVAPICSGPAIRIPVYGESAIYSRVKYPPRRIVVLSLRANIRLRHHLVFGSNFSCTQFISARTRVYTITAPNPTNPVLRIQGTDNILIHGINFVLPISNANQPQCPYDQSPYVPYSVFLDKWHCPAVWMFASYAVQLAQGRSYGRLDIVACNYSRIDSMTVRVHPQNTPGAIVSEGPSIGYSLIRSNAFITNNWLIGGPLGAEAQTGLFLARGSVGANVNNNRITNFLFAGIQLGFGQRNVGDAMLNRVMFNYVESYFGNLGDNAGIYTNGHWVNPGNVLRCNYVRNGGHCLYLDYASTGFVVDGLVCVNTQDGIKMNTGKNNVVRGVLAVNMAGTNGYISCQNYNVNNCNQNPTAVASTWVRDLYGLYNYPPVTTFYPYLKDFCNRTTIYGINCNAGTWWGYRARATGKCSGLPTQNIFEIADVSDDNSDRSPFFQGNCDPFPAVKRLNFLRQIHLNISQAKFINPAQLNYGLSPLSPIPKRFPNFRSCPFTSVGPQQMPFFRYQSLFNFRQPPPRPLA